jgi:hypothetical protein
MATVQEPSSVGGNYSLKPLDSKTNCLAYCHNFISIKAAEPSLGVPSSATYARQDVPYYFPIISNASTYKDSRAFTNCLNTLVYCGQNIGVGTDNPTERLTVTGNILGSGNIVIGNNNGTSQNYSSITGGENNIVSGIDSGIGSGAGNTVSGDYSYVATGTNNTILSAYGFIGGGFSNQINNTSGLIVGGTQNVINGNASTITGGGNNKINTAGSVVNGGAYNQILEFGDHAVIAGGFQNTIYGAGSFIGGGCKNTSNSDYQAIVAGCKNTTHGLGSTISGGFENSNYGYAGSISGGYGNIIYAAYGSVVGGQSNTSSGTYGSFVGGGGFNIADASSSVIGGGYSNTASGYYSVIAGGFYNCTFSDTDTVGGGYRNCSHGRDATISGGTYNLSCGCSSAVAGGRSNSACGDYSSIGGGSFNLACGIYSTVNGGDQNKACGLASSITGGVNNRVCRDYSAVTGGINNYIKGNCSAIIGGGNNTLCATDSFILGSNINVKDIDNTTFVENLSVIENITSDIRITKSLEVVKDAMFHQNVTIEGSLHVLSGITYTQTNFEESSAIRIINNGVGPAAYFEQVFGVYPIAEFVSNQGNDVLYVGNSPANPVNGTTGFIGVNTINPNVELTVNGSVSSNNTIYANLFQTVSGGNSYNWDSVYNGVKELSGAWNNPNTVIDALTAKIPYIYGENIGSIKPLSGNNISTGLYSNIGGGINNTSSGRYSTVSGGLSSTASGDYSIAGGYNNKASEYASNVSGGFNNTASGYASNVSGGQSNNASGNRSNVAGGRDNNASGNHSNVAGGYANTASGYYSNVASGVFNNASQRNSNVAGGGYNTASAYYSNVAGGLLNKASGCYSNVAGGRSNTASSCYSNVAGGCDNTASGYFSNVAGGCCNINSGNYSSILGGCANDTKGLNNTFILGSNLSASQANFTYVNNISSKGSVYGNFYGDGSYITNIALSSLNYNNESLQALLSGITTSPYEYGDVHSSIKPVLGNNIQEGLDVYNVISGGYKNKITVSGYINTTIKNSVIAGGNCNCLTASGDYSSLEGSFIGAGKCNSTGSGFDVIGGGFCNKITQGLGESGYVVIAGGECNTANEKNTFIGGGQCNITSAQFSVNVGGQCNCALNTGSSIVGGINNKALGQLASIGGGQNNTASDYFSVVAGGYGNTASGYYSFVGGGYSNVATLSSFGVPPPPGISSATQTIVAGYSNFASGIGNTIVGGLCNKAICYMSSILGGVNNTASGYASVVVGGGGFSGFNSFGNIACGNLTFIGVGRRNIASGQYSAILGGCKNDTNYKSNTYILGSSLSASQSNFTYVNNISSEKLVYDKDGNSNQWNYTYQLLTSSSSDPTFITSLSDSKIFGNARNHWDSVYAQVYNLSSNWDTAYNRSTVYANNSASYATKKYVNDGFLPLSGGLMTGPFASLSSGIFYGDLMVMGGLTASLLTYTSTTYSNTSALSVVNTGPGPALYVKQALGPYDIASFYNDKGTEVLHVGNLSPIAPYWGKVGINESYPTHELTIRGEVSATGDFWTNGQVNAFTANLGNTYSAPQSADFISLNILGSSYKSLYNKIQNLTPGVSASTDISIYNDNSTNYVDLGIASSIYDGNKYIPKFNVTKANDTYLFNNGAGNLVIGNADNTSSSGLVFFTGGTLSGTKVNNGNERLRITQSGNIGINESNPQVALSINGAISATQSVKIGTTTLDFLDSSSKYTFLGGSTNDRSIGLFSVNNNASGPAIRTFYARGASTITPLAANAGDVLGSFKNYGYNGTNFNNYTNDGATAINSVATTDFDSLSGSARLDFVTTYLLNEPQTRMTINDDGNVGIGTTTPNTNLTVVGGISATGNIYGNFVGTGTVVKAASSFGDNISKTFIYNHNLGTRDIVTQVYDNSSYNVVYPTISNTSINTITITFNTTPTNNQYRVVVTG